MTNYYTRQQRRAEAWDAYVEAARPATVAFDAAVQPLWDAYTAASDAALDVYEATVRPLWDAYQAALAAIDAEEQPS